MMLTAISLLSFAVYSSKKNEKNDNLSSSMTAQEELESSSASAEATADKQETQEASEEENDIDNISEDIGDEIPDENPPVGEENDPSSASAEATAGKENINPFSNDTMIEGEPESSSAETSSSVKTTEDKMADEANKFADTILYYGSTCPHCVIVKEHITEDNLPIAMKEVYQNKDNSSELIQKAEICGIPSNKIGVPFLWSDGECIIGGENIIDFLNTK